MEEIRLLKELSGIFRIGQSTRSYAEKITRRIIIIKSTALGILSSVVLAEEEIESIKKHNCIFRRVGPKFETPDD